MLKRIYQQEKMKDDYEKTIDFNLLFINDKQIKDFFCQNSKEN
jgi:hypothetical protein